MNSSRKRVVVTGMAGITALGEQWEHIEAKLRAGQNGVRCMSDWDRYVGLNTRLAAPVEFTSPLHYLCKIVWFMWCWFCPTLICQE